MSFGKSAQTAGESSSTKSGTTIKSNMWSVVQSGGDTSNGGGGEGFDSPNARCKHSAVATPSGFIYVQGGRSGNLPLKDIWKFDPVQSQWEEVHCRGNRPPCLQEHTMVAWKSNMYVFGGEVGFAYTGETPLWILDTGTAIWRKHHLRGPGTPPQPSGRRGHSGVVFEDAMHVYGGYQDLRGSSPELWTFDFHTELWCCQYPCPNGGNNVSGDQHQPAPRHNHSAVVHDGTLWVYGGMTDLQARGDFWKWDFESKQWSRVRGGNRSGPGELHSHTAIAVMGFMYLFGGERGGILLSDLWRFHFATEVWERIQAEGVLPNPRCRHVAIPNPLLCESSSDSRTAGGGSLFRSRAWETDENIPRKTTLPNGGVNKSISMCFGQAEHAVAESGSTRRPFKFRVHPVRLCSKSTASDDDDDEDANDDSYVASYNRQTAQVNISRRLRDRLSRSSRLVRSISSGNYSTVLQESLATFGGLSGGGGVGPNAVVGELERLVEETPPPSIHRTRRPLGHPQLPKSHSSDAVLESDSENSTPRHHSSVTQTTGHVGGVSRGNPSRRARPLSEGARDCCGGYRARDLPSGGCAVCFRPRNGYDGPLVTVGDFEEDDDENLVVIPGQVDVRNICKSPIRIPITGPLIDLGELPSTPPLVHPNAPRRLDVAVIGATVTTHSATSRGSTRMSNSTSRSSGYLSATNVEATLFKDDVVEIEDEVILSSRQLEEEDGYERDDGFGPEPLSLLDTNNPQPRHKDFAATLAGVTGSTFKVSPSGHQHHQRHSPGRDDSGGLLLELKTFTPTHEVGSCGVRPLEELQNKKERARSWDRVSKRREMAVAPSCDDLSQRRSWVKEGGKGSSGGTQGLWTRSPCPKPRLQHHNWQLCMYMCGGREQGAPNVSRQPMVMWRLYV